MFQFHSSSDSTSSKLIAEEEDEENCFNKTQKSTLSSLSSNTLTTSEDINAQKSILENPSCNSIDSMMFSSLDSDKNDYNSLIACDDCNHYFNERSYSNFKSITNLTSNQDPFLASSIGIKCINYKPLGYIFLTRRLLDLYMTDGKRKIEIAYNYSKKFKKKRHIPSTGNLTSFSFNLTQFNYLIKK